MRGKGRGRVPWGSTRNLGRGAAELHARLDEFDPAEIAEEIAASAQKSRISSRFVAFRNAEKMRKKVESMRKKVENMRRFQAFSVSCAESR